MRSMSNGALLVRVAVDVKDSHGHTRTKNVMVERQHYVSLESAEDTVKAVRANNETLCVNATLTFHL